MLQELQLQRCLFSFKGWWEVVGTSSLCCRRRVRRLIRLEMWREVCRSLLQCVAVRCSVLQPRIRSEMWRGVCWKSSDKLDTISGLFSREPYFQGLFCKSAPILKAFL